jgi:phosphate transport system permease protein
VHPPTAPEPPHDPHATPEAVARLRRARRADRAAGRAIRIGGVAVLLAVVMIFVFVGAEAVPLFGGATLTPGADVRFPAPVVAIASDEYRTHVAGVTRDGEAVVLDAATGGEKRRVRVVPPGSRPAAAAVDLPGGPVFVVGGADGKLRVVTAEVKIAFDAARTRTVSMDAAVGEPLDARDDGPIEHVAAKVLDGEKAFVVYAGSRHVGLARFKLDSDRVRTARLDEPRLWESGADVTTVSLALLADVVRVYAGLSDGRVVRWDAEWTGDPVLHESIDAGRAPVRAVPVVFGGETIATGCADGRVATWFGVRASKDASNWDLTRIREFDAVPGGVSAAAPTTRGKGFVVLGADGSGRIEYATTGKTRAHVPPGGSAPSAAAFTPKNDGLLVADESGRVRTFTYSDPHPESGFAALFSSLWYEGGTEPERKWQSTGGTDDFEPKLSVSVLVFGTMKGVVYALLISVPVALLAAIYTALFLPARVKAWVKPTLEVMAALPSVVVGLLAALWLSPLVERNLTSTFAAFPSFLVAFALLVVFWAFLPRHVRNRWTQSAGILGVTAVAVLASVALAAFVGPRVEELLFGGDVQAWIRDATGMRYDPRNAMVVGFAMGFAVIPVIFTISEDAISNVPKSLWAASEALGASRWQTTVRVVLPAATPGIFAALMLGFGRAIGETMIVLMATGNTPILEWSPFNGMRTISACIAVEIPEAPHGGTLYRVLFLSGVLLFAFTFVCNTVAEVVASRLRRRYGRAG